MTSDKNEYRVASDAQPDARTDRGPARFAAHSTFLGISSFQILVMFRRGLFYTFLSIYLREYLGLSITETTLFATIPMAISASAQALLWGRISDRFQLRRTLIILGEVLGAAGTVGVWFAHIQPESRRVAGYAIIVGLGVTELFWSMSNLGWAALVSDLYQSGKRAVVQGHLASIGAMGRIIGVWIGGVLYDGLGAFYRGWGFREGTLFFVSAGAMLISTVPIFFLPEGGIGSRENPNGGGDDTGPETSRLFWIFLVGIVLVNLGKNSMSVLYGPFLSLPSGFALSSRQVGHIVNVRSIAMILTGFCIAALARRFGNAKSLLLGVAAAVAGTLIFGFAGGIPVLILGNALLGCSDVVVVAAAYALVSVLIPPVRRGRLFGFYNAATFISWGLAGTLVAGPLMDSLMALGAAERLAYKIGFAAASLVALAGFFILAWLTKRMRGVRENSGDRDA